jgi:hypothetical protein
MAVCDGLLHRRNKINSQQQHNAAADQQDKEETCPASPVLAERWPVCDGWLATHMSRTAHQPGIKQGNSTASGSNSCLARSTGTQCCCKQRCMLLG